MTSVPGPLDDLWASFDHSAEVPAAPLTQTRAPVWDDETVRARKALPWVDPVDARALPQDFAVTGVLGEGGMGRVLLAHQDSLNREVAVKVTKDNASVSAIDALVHEALTAGALEHPSVIPVYALTFDGQGKPAMVMKRVDGVSWQMLLRNVDDAAWTRLGASGLDHLEANVEILRQVCNALAFAHSRGVIHRDVKPSNVLIGEFGEVYVADWGIATGKGTPGARKTQLIGSPVYLAPEMTLCDPAVLDERTDVFLLGSTLYEVLSGRAPWVGARVQDVLAAAFRCVPAPLSPDAPAELVAICARAMAREKEDRYQTVLELREALTGFLHHRGSVELARAADERLSALLASLEGAGHDQIYPLLSECRFGFSQALREWPGNERAATGLQRCLEATAAFELRRGNLAAAKALLADVSAVPEALATQLRELEARQAIDQAHVVEARKLVREMDLQVAIAERLKSFAASIVAIIIGVGLRLRWEPQGELLRWRETLVLSGFALVFFTELWFRRRTLLVTRINYQVMWVLGIAVLGTLAQRIMGTALGSDGREVTLENQLLVLVVAVGSGINVHRGFFWSAGAMAVGLLLALAVPGSERWIFGLSSASAMMLAALSWGRWKPRLAT
jgi:serine/threonine-protein kinase